MMASLTCLHAVQALTLLFQVMESRASLSDRFYRLLYEMLLHSELHHTSKLVRETRLLTVYRLMLTYLQALFLNVVFRAIKNDPNRPRVLAFVKRLMQVGDGSSCLCVY
jgi:ribosome biogenesis protein MAK21